MIHARLPVLGAIALIMAMIFNCGVAVAGPTQPSADYIMRGCREAAFLIAFSNVGESEEEVARMNFCAGVVVGLSFMGQPYGICVPPGTSSQHVASIVVQYIDGQVPASHYQWRSTNFSETRGGLSVPFDPSHRLYHWRNSE